MRAARRRTRHGLHAVMARVKVRGLAAIDRRTAAARALIAWRDELLSDLGGAETVSAQEGAIVELAVRTRLYVEHLDGWLMGQTSLVLARRRAVLPVLRERQQLADSLARLLGQLGLGRRARPLPSLREILEAEAAAAPREPRSTAPESDELSEPAAVALAGASESERPS